MRSWLSSLLAMILTLTLLLISLPATAGAAFLSSLTLNPTSVTGGNPATGTLSLTGPPAVGQVVALSSSQPAVATVLPAIPAMVRIFTVTTKPVVAPTRVIISAQTLGVRASASLTVLPPAPSAVTFSIPYDGPGGAPIKGKVSLTGPAPPGGAVVLLSSSNQATAEVPGFVQVVAGSLEAVFDIVTVPVAADTAVAVNARYAAVTRTGTLRLRRPLPSYVKFSPTNSVTGGTPVTLTMGLDGSAPAGGAAFTFRLSSSPLGWSSVAISVPATVTLAAGAAETSSTVTTKPIAQSVKVFLNPQPADLPSNKTLVYNMDTPWLMVLAPALNEVGFNPTSVSYQAGSADGWVSLTGPAPWSGVVVLLSWSDTTAATVPPSVTVPAGASTASFKATTKPVNQPTPFTIFVLYGGVIKTATLTVTP